MMEMDGSERWLEWAVELQSLAQAGLHYGKDVFDRERYERVREIAAEMVSHQSEIPVEKVKDRARHNLPPLRLRRRCSSSAA